MIDAASIRFLVAALAGWLDHRQQEVVGYLVEENRTLRAQLGGRRIRLKMVGSSGWIRTSNPPVNSVMQVVGLAGSSCQ